MVYNVVGTQDIVLTFPYWELIPYPGLTIKERSICTYLSLLGIDTVSQNPCFSLQISYLSLLGIGTVISIISQDSFS